MAASAGPADEQAVVSARAPLETLETLERAAMEVAAQGALGVRSPSDSETKAAAAAALSSSRAGEAAAAILEMNSPPMSAVASPRFSSAWFVSFDSSIFIFFKLVKVY